MSSGEPRPNAALYFLHIPKTAGTSLKRFIRSALPVDRICPAETWHQLLAIPEPERSSYDVYSGHFYSYLHRAIRRDYRTITFLRDPIERSLSHYAHVMRSPDHYFFERARAQGSLRRFLQDPVTRALITNFQTRALAQDVDVMDVYSRCTADELARLQVEQRVETQLPVISDDKLLRAALDRMQTVEFVGTTDDASACAARLAQAERWSHAGGLENLNIGTNRFGFDSLDRRTRRLLVRQVELDQVLYDSARALDRSTALSASA